MASREDGSPVSTIRKGNEGARFGGCDLSESPQKASFIFKKVQGFQVISMANSSYKGNNVRRLRSIFEPRTPSGSPNSRSLPSPWSPVKTPPRSSKSLNSDLLDSPWRLPGTEDRVVIYFTSLRGIRRTFEDCYTARMIVKGFRVNLDERDISMDKAYKKELQNVLGEKNPTLPQIFIKGKHIGGAEVIKQLNETGELVRLLRGLLTRPPGYVCQCCGDVRFIPCCNCDGSRKLFDEDQGLLRKCPECNENGLVRCPICCDS
ncbi:PREDICTED: uncharacterized protein At5g39865-like [Ipomoea nil]|uniref:uncharacterized protein At5g39865-like n=1 Tax=Ipomoea nil TaxID=35883 RepID=UPI0009012084|nr:PREDICTED: uncharacterized protein At5g39865-like [Ipomoea nil]